MKIRRLLIIVCAGVAICVIVALVDSAYWERKQTPFQNAPKLISALQGFSRDQIARGQRLPPEISLRDLLRAGYLATNDVRAFEGMEVTFSTGVDESHPEMILAWARTPDGQFICALADGSVQQVSRARYEQMRAHLGQPDGATNRSQPIRAETNSTSSAAGSGR